MCSGAAGERSAPGTRGGAKRLRFSHLFLFHCRTERAAEPCNVVPYLRRVRAGGGGALRAAVHEQHGERPGNISSCGNKTRPFGGERRPHDPPGPVSPDRVEELRRDGKAGTHWRPGSAVQPEKAPHHVAVKPPPRPVHLLKRPATTKCCVSPHLAFITDGKFLPPPCPPAGKNLPSGLARHARAEAMGVLSLALVGLKRNAHSGLPLLVVEVQRGCVKHRRYKKNAILTRKQGGKKKYWACVAQPIVV